MPGGRLPDRLRLRGAGQPGVRAARGRAARTRRCAYDRQARDGLIDTYGDQHPFTLAANINYASDLAACGDLAAAIRVGQETLAKCRGSLGEDHPDTLMAAANLAIDEAASGNQADGRAAAAPTRCAGTRDTLTTEHPEARAALQGTRLTAEIEPY